MGALRLRIDSDMSQDTGHRDILLQIAQILVDPEGCVLIFGFFLVNRWAVCLTTCQTCHRIVLERPKIIDVDSTKTVYIIFGEGALSKSKFNQESQVVSTHLWNTPLNLSQQAVKGILS